MLKLNLDPTFKAEVQVTVPGQVKPGTLPLTFKYRSRKEYTDWIESLREVRDAGEIGTDGESIKEGEVTREAKTPTEAFLEFVIGWGLPDELGPENVDKLLDRYPNAYVEIITQYSKLLFESRLKN